jgi:hypothetical protein
MWRCVGLVRDHVSDQRQFYEDPRWATVQKKKFLIITAVKTSDLT